MMAQSNSNDSNLRDIHSFWQNQMVDPLIPWEEWDDLFQIAVIAKENIDIKKFPNSIEMHHPQPPFL